MHQQKQNNSQIQREKHKENLDVKETKAGWEINAENLCTRSGV